MPYGFKDFVVEVGGFWYKKACQWLRSKPTVEILTDKLANAHTFEEWEAAALSLDRYLNTDLWRRNPTGKHFDVRLIQDRLDALTIARENGDTDAVISLFRAGLVRNLGNITSADLYSVAYAGTKVLIDQYIRAMCLAISYLTSLPTHRDRMNGMTAQDKMDLMHDARQAYGRSALLLQGGAVYGLSHFGVVKALHLRGLLPRVIVGHGVGALVAALVCIHKEEELLPFLEGQTPILSSFSSPPISPTASPSPASSSSSPFPFSLLSLLSSPSPPTTTLTHLVNTFLGDTTFEEAYSQTKRVLNISVSTPSCPGAPTLLNHITARDVRIRPAALASNTSPPPPSSSSTPPTILLSKSSTGTLHPWRTHPRTTIPLPSHRPAPSLSHGRDSPLQRTAELFNVNHFILSQARPYVSSFLRSLAARHPRPYAASSPSSSSPTTWSLARSLVPVPSIARFAGPALLFIAAEAQHRLAQLDALGLLPPLPRRLLLGESVPGSSITLSPELGVGDWMAAVRGGGWEIGGRGRNGEGTGREGLEYWILKGERAVWPAVSALKVRLVVEGGLEGGYQGVRIRRDGDGGVGAGAGVGVGVEGVGGGELRNGLLRNGEAGVPDVEVVDVGPVLVSVGLPREGVRGDGEEDWEGERMRERRRRRRTTSGSGIVAGGLRGAGGVERLSGIE